MTKTCTLTILDEINVHFTGLDVKTVRTLENKYKWTTPDARYQPAVRLGRIDGYTRLFNKGLFYLNLIDEEFISTLSECGYELEVVDKRFPYERVIPTVDEFLYKHVIFKGEQLTLREVQVNAINAALAHQCGIFELATGSGKTATCGAIADLHRAYGRTMIIVPSVDLATQTLRTFKAMGIEDCGEFHSGTKGVETIIVGTWQSLIRYPESIEGVVCLIADECHEYNAKEILQFLTTTCRNVPYRYGFTGTLPKEVLSRKQLEAALGKVLYSKVAHELQAEGILAECFIDVLQTVEDPDLEFAYHDEEKNFLLNNPVRRMYLRDTVDRIRQSGNTLVIIDTIELGTWLEQNIPNCVFISGPMPSKKRMKNYDRMAVEDNAVFVCTRGVIKRGIDIARIFNLIYVEIGKKYEGVIQSVGRGLRTSDDKTKVNIFDICASTKYSKRHLTERKKFYNEAKYPFKVTKVNYR